MSDRMKIMVVDDNTVNLATVEQDLKDKYEVIPMISGRRAVKYLYRDKVDLILLDVQMPIMDGIETLREIRTQPNGTTVPVIFLTAKNDKNTVIEGSKLGIMDYIMKPFEADDLQNRIERVFKRLGRLPMEEEELYTRVKDIYQDLVEDKSKASLHKMEEVLGYQINEEISGRIKIAHTKMEEGQKEASMNMMERIVKILEKNLNASSKNSAIPISIGEVNARLLYILDDLRNFKIKDATNKVVDLIKYDIPEYVMEDLKIIKTRLEDYNDVEAEQLVQGLLEKMKNSSPINTANAKMDIPREEQNGIYHYNRLV